MNKLDKGLHFIGLIAGGLVAVAASGGLALPAWLVAVSGVVAYAAGATAAPLMKKAPGKGQSGT